MSGDPDGPSLVAAGLTTTPQQAGGMRAVDQDDAYNLTMVQHYRGARVEGSFWEKHSLSIVLAAILAAQTTLAIALGHSVWLSDQVGHAQPVADAWGSDFWVWWGWEYNVSLVADTFGVILIVLLSKRLYEKDSAESNK